ncbi:ABC transporter permease [Leifsonia sp. McL0607]|uniref:ABC transporter permease n=1 Tax=Leifsonia sp. McL0607 TaxID=3415672 RepID=UPI003CF15121
MIRFIGLRVLQAVPVLVGSTFVIYALVFALPGDPIVALFGDRTPNPAVAARLREQYHLDQPFIIQYLHYLGGVVRGDFGTSFTGEPVADILARTFPVTLRLAALALVLEITVGVTLGLVSGLRAGGPFDASVLVLSLLVISVPVFVLALVAQDVFGVWLGWTRPTVGQGAPIQDLLLPAAALAAIGAAEIVRVTRATVADTARMDFVRFAAAKGMSRGHVARVHVLRNSLIPVVTLLGTNFGTMLAGATVVEGVFNVPGVGRTLYQAIIRGEGPTVVSLVTVMVVVYLVVGLVVDLLYAVLDPRIRHAS